MTLIAGWVICFVVWVTLNDVNLYYLTWLAAHVYQLSHGIHCLFFQTARRDGMASRIHDVLMNFWRGVACLKEQSIRFLWRSCLIRISSLLTIAISRQPWIKHIWKSSENEVCTLAYRLLSIVIILSVIYLMRATENARKDNARPGSQEWTTREHSDHTLLLSWFIVM